MKTKLEKLSYKLGKEAFSKRIKNRLEDENFSNYVVGRKGCRIKECIIAYQRGYKEAIEQEIETMTDYNRYDGDVLNLEKVDE